MFLITYSARKEKGFAIKMSGLWLCMNGCGEWLHKWQRLVGWESRRSTGRIRAEKRHMDVPVGVGARHKDVVLHANTQPGSIPRGRGTKQPSRQNNPVSCCPLVSVISPPVPAQWVHVLSTHDVREEVYQRHRLLHVRLIYISVTLNIQTSSNIDQHWLRYRSIPRRNKSVIRQIDYFWPLPPWKRHGLILAGIVTGMGYPSFTLGPNRHQTWRLTECLICWHGIMQGITSDQETPFFTERDAAVGTWNPLILSDCTTQELQSG